MPATHDVHAAAAERDHEPAGQSTHVDDALAPVTAEYCPALHATHAAELLTLAMDDHVPAAHLMHVNEPANDHVPGAQVTHPLLVEYVPALQLPHELAPGGAEYPI